MFAGACEQEAEHVLTSMYEFFFLPVPNVEHYQAGIHFLQQLKGAQYNYTDLPLALMPYSWKRPQLPNWLTHEQSHFGDIMLLHPQAPSLDDETSRNEPNIKKDHLRIFCSQMGLLLCYASQAMPHHRLDPASCLPEELERLLLEEGFAQPCPLSCISFERDRASLARL